ncbi:hypothetical protein B586_02530 [Mycobacterium haemophilum DSM 44634]|uniref:DUF3566 domain-containing protein n=1 Tax=Mycobacterium haemophilum TaxID=29311 RepID=UPI0006562778|nr:DUF3566 domain-containing protein [Mycobacterium haemophilum]AKN15689.1 hypothetical protein B586_02530 [Mycobacterium haemophilum DSM 44634]MCV7341226.1 DUF3566 domain-containing protein [Mycobacterium haemophilum DSM 44634]
MTSPNEPRALNQGDSLMGDGSVERAGLHRATSAPGGPPGGLPGGRSPEPNDSPPWQRGAARASHPGYRPSEPHTDARPSSSVPGADVRLNRFISGTAAPAVGAQLTGKNNSTQELEPVPARQEVPPAEAYASELPDLSGPVPRAVPRKPAPDRGSGTPGTGRSAIAEARETSEARVQVSRRSRGPVRASMQIRRIDPWSTLKVSLLLSVALFFVWMIAVAFLYLVLGGMGVWAKLNSNVGDLLNNTSGSSGELVSSSTIFGGAVLIGLVNIVLMTAMATIAAFVYNLTTDLVGGVEVTLADLD